MGGQPVGDQPPVGAQIPGQVHQGTPVDRQDQMRVGHHRPVAGEVLGRGGHARLAHAVHPGARQLRHHIRGGVEGALPDGLVHPIVEVDAGGKGDVDPVRPQFRGHEPPKRAGQRHAGLWIEVELVPDAPRRR